MDTKEYYKIYYMENKEKFEAYQQNTPRKECEVCGKCYKWNDYERHLKTQMHKNRVLKQQRQNYY